MKESIEKKVKDYESNADELDAARQMAQEELNFDEIAPSTEQNEIDDQEEGSNESESFLYFNPDRPENQQNYDIGIDIGLSARTVIIDVNQSRMSTDDFIKLVRSLNLEQMEFFLHVLKSIKLNKQPLRTFLTGGAGVGKSVVIRALNEALNRHLCSTEGDNPENCRVLLCAPTGKAAFNIGGTTVHSAFKIPASQGFTYKQLDSDSLNALRTKYRDLSVVMIDEVSMVGNNMLNFINERLKHIKGSRDYFGGVHVVLIGDLF